MLYEPMAHQAEGMAKAFRKPYFAYFAEQGTGKTYMTLGEMEDYFLRKWLEGLLIVAPKGVHDNWVSREIPKLLECHYIAAAWEQTKRYQRKMEEMFATRRRVLKILAINIDALNTEKGLNEAKRFLASQKSAMAVDESTSIKSPDSNRSARVVYLGRSAACRRLLNGTPITQSPFDLYQQFEFLKPEGQLLRCATYRAFVARYGVLLPPDNPLVEHAKARARGKGKQPQIVQRDRRGMPMYRNLDELRELVAPHVHRVRKKDCLDLPEKIFTQRTFQMGPKTKRAYAELDDELPITWEGEKLPVREEGRLMKAMQVNSGFMMVEDSNEIINFDGDRNGKLKELDQFVSEMSGEQFIIWAHFHEEFRMLRALLEKRNREFVEYHGQIGSQRRKAAIDTFQNQRAQIFLASAAAAGMGLTLTAASTAVYYTNTFNLWHRWQSEDRPHRIGTRNPVLYVDFVCPGTISHAVVRKLDAKRGVAEQVID